MSVITSNIIIDLKGYMQVLQNLTYTILCWLFCYYAVLCWLLLCYYADYYVIMMCYADYYNAIMLYTMLTTILRYAGY